jgi:DNA-binding CsgD family transcriptional regulator
MIRLVGEVAELRGEHVAKKRYLMEGLCKLIDADAWVWALSCQRKPTEPQVYVSAHNGGFTDQSFTKLLEAIEHPEMIDITAKFFTEVNQENAHLTRRRYQITDQETFLRSEAHLAWKAANIGPTILSMRPLDSESASTIALYRFYGRREFTARESRIAHIILNEVPWLHLQGWSEDRGASVPKLSRRLRLTLNLLVSGQNQKQIAQNMGISIGTVQGYVKEVYRHFGLHSQAELMNRFLTGDGRDGA